MPTASAVRGTGARSGQSEEAGARVDCGVRGLVLAAMGVRGLVLAAYLVKGKVPAMSRVKGDGGERSGVW